MRLSKFMPAIAAGALMLGLGVTSCSKTDEEKAWADYEEWRDTNNDWLRELTIAGDYTRITPEWNRNVYILMRWLNDTTKTSGNLRPLYTSTVSVKYKGWLYDGEPFDSSYVQTDSVATLSPSALIDGWVIALERMHVGDKVEAIVPYDAAYSYTGSGSVPPYSNLRFEIELRDVPTYEVRAASN